MKLPFYILQVKTPSRLNGDWNDYGEPIKTVKKGRKAMELLKREFDSSGAVRLVKISTSVVAYRRGTL